MSNGNGWDDPKPKANGGKLLFLGKNDKGVSVRVRFVGKPTRLPDTTTADGKTLRKYACPVIHKTQGEDGKIQRTAKWFEFSPMVYYAVADLIKDPDWGLPENYDIEVTRTEEQGSYYTVRPKPNGKPLTDAEKTLIEALGSYEDAVGGNGDGAKSGHGGGGGDSEWDPFADE